MQGDVMAERRMKVAKWTDWFNLLERRGQWEHWMNSAGLEQERYGYWLNTVTGEKRDDRGFQASEGEA